MSVQSPRKCFKFSQKNEQSLRGAVPDNPTIKSLIQAFKQAEDNVQSLLCLDYSKKAIEKVMGISVSWYLYTESRFLAKHIGPGGDLPDLPYRTLTFSEKELTEVFSFICAKKNISGLAWGCHEFKTLDNINVRFGSENFTNIRNLIQEIVQRFKKMSTLLVICAQLWALEEV